MLKLLAVDADKLRVLYKGVTNRVPAEATDLIPNVAAARLLKMRSTVEIGDKKMENIELAAFLLPNSIEIIWRGGSGSWAVERVPEEFRKAWGLTDDYVNAMKERHKQLRAARLGQSGARTIEEDIGQKPEVDPTDNSVPIVKKFMRGFVADPSTLEYLEWRGPNTLDLKGERFWAVQVRYRCKNVLGTIMEQESHLVHPVQQSGHRPRRAVSAGFSPASSTLEGEQARVVHDRGFHLNEILLPLRDPHRHRAIQHRIVERHCLRRAGETADGQPVARVRHRRCGIVRHHVHRYDELPLVHLKRQCREHIPVPQRRMLFVAVENLPLFAKRSDLNRQRLRRLERNAVGKCCRQIPHCLQRRRGDGIERNVG